MLKRFILRAHNIWDRIMHLLHGRRFQQLIEDQNVQLEILSKRLCEQTTRSEARLDFLQDLLRQQILLASPDTIEFEQLLRYELTKALLSEYVDNFDPYCGATIEAIQRDIDGALANYRQNFSYRVDLFIAQLPMAELQRLSLQLSDTGSRILLAQLIAYRLLGLTKVRLRSAEDTQSDRDFYAKLQDLVSSEFSPYCSGLFEVPCYDLRRIGLNFRCYTIPFAINTEFRNQQYATEQVHIQTGDWVLDCGACWGDTSLWFADQAGPAGRVFSFEFIPTSLDILQANLAMNPELSKSIELVTHPVAEKSGNMIRCQDNGAASTFKIVSTEDPTGPCVEARTISIDDWAASRSPDKVDFIKMDIEGAELDALRGAIKTLTHYRPRLAIALYHRPEDLYQIPDFLESLKLGYQFHLKHPTSAGFETVLLARSVLD
jgi:FkbM family methyltransferase